MPEPAPSRTRRLVGLLALGVALGLVVRLADDYLNRTDMPRPVDFLAFWAAGHLQLRGESPYDPARLFELQAANRTSESGAVPIWNPPWTLALLLPLGALSVGSAQLVWVLGQMALIAVSAVALWRLYGGAPRLWWVPLLLTVSSGTFWWQAVCGQADGIVLFGLAGFLVARNADRPFLAGVLGALTAVKPHLLPLFAIGLFIDALRTSSGRRVVLGGVAALAAAAVVASLPNPGVWGAYLSAATGPGSQYYSTLTHAFNPTLGAWVRHSIAGQPFWVQLVPAVVAAVGFALYWLRAGGPDRWADALPWVVPVCLMTAPYGSWPCDLVLLLLPAVACAARLQAARVPVRRVLIPLAVYELANVGVVAMLVGKGRLELYVWAAPLLSACLFAAHRAAAASRTADGDRSVALPADAPGVVHLGREDAKSDQAVLN